jgi:hypothetical protein
MKTIIAAFVLLVSSLSYASKQTVSLKDPMAIATAISVASAEVRAGIGQRFGDVLTIESLAVAGFKAVEVKVVQSDRPNYKHRLDLVFADRNGKKVPGEVLEVYFYTSSY